MFSPLGANIGHRFLLFSGEQRSPSSHLYLYSAPIVPPSNFVPTLTCKQPALSGDVVGLVFSLLIGVATLVFVSLTWRRSRASSSGTSLYGESDDTEPFKPYAQL